MKNFYKYLMFCMLLFCSKSGYSQVLISEDFNLDTSFPQGWVAPTLPAFTITSSNSCDGNSVRGPLNSNSIAPELAYMSQVTTGKDIVVSFDYKLLQNTSGNPATDDDFGYFTLQYSTDDGHSWLTYHTIDETSHATSTSCATITHTISGVDVPAGSEFAWRMKGSHHQGSHYIYIDDFTAIEQVDCLQPTDIVIEDVTFDSIEISWTELNATPATEWEVAYCPEGIEPGNPACSLTNIARSVTSNPYTITGLPNGTKYDIYVRSVCSTNEESAWSDPIRVQTIAIGTDCDNPYEIASLPFDHNSDTEIYDNIYDGTPGGSCSTVGRFLEGSDVVYKYNNQNDDILQIELSGSLDGSAGVFVYESCDDIGSECFAGAITANGEDFGIYDLYVDQGKDYYIVVSTEGPNTSTEYTLDITGFECTASWESPEGESTYEFYAQVLDDYSETRIGVNTTIEGSVLKWYDDAALSNKITDLSLITLAENDEYWVVQEVMDCTSPPLHIIFTEFDCNVLSITDVQAQSMICDKGETILEANAATDNLIWYDQETGGDAIGVGSSFKTPTLTETTSFWVSEFFRGEGVLTNQANPGPVTSEEYSSTNSGLEFDLYEPTVIVDVEAYVTGLAGDVTIELIDDKGSVQQKTISVPGGSKNYPKAITLELNFVVDDPNEGPFRLMKTSGPAMIGTPSGKSSYPYSLGNVGNVTSGISESSSSSNYYYFYNWTVVSSVPLCESSRLKIEAVVDEMMPISIDAVAHDACVGSEANLTAVSDYSDYKYTWEWVDLDGVTQSKQATTITPTLVQGTTFTVYAENPDTECFTEDEIFIDVVGVGDIPVNPSSVSMCVGDIIQLHAGEIIHTFEDTITDWSFVNNSVPAAGINASKAGWKQVASPYSLADNAASNDNSSFMITSADALGPGSTVGTSMTSPSINLVGVKDATLEFYQFYRHHSTKSTTASVSISDDAGVSWDNIETYTSDRGSSNDFEKVSIDLEDFIGSASVQVKFEYTGAWGWWWAIDNVSIAQSYANGDVTWSGNNTDELYLDERATIEYTGQPANIVYFKGEDAGIFDFDVDLYIEGCGSPVVSNVSVEVNEADKPIGDSEQEFNAGSKVQEIEVQGDNLRYYIFEEDEYIPQSINSELIDGETYYISQTVGDCISEYLEVAVVVVCPQPMDLSVTVDLAENGVTASAIVFWKYPQDAQPVDSYQVIVKDSEGQIFEDKIISDQINYLIVDTLPLEKEFTVELYSVCDVINGVVSDVVVESFNTIQLGVADFINAKLQYYPNPVVDLMTIESDFSIEKIEVITKEGKKIMIIDNIHTMNTEIDLGSLSTGTYLLLATVEGQTKVLRVIKK